MIVTEEKDMSNIKTAFFNLEYGDNFRLPFNNDLFEKHSYKNISYHNHNAYNITKNIRVSIKEDTQIFHIKRVANDTIVFKELDKGEFFKVVARENSTIFKKIDDSPRLNSLDLETTILVSIGSETSITLVDVVTFRNLEVGSFFKTINPNSKVYKKINCDERHNAFDSNSLHSSFSKDVSVEVVKDGFEVKYEEPVLNVMSQTEINKTKQDLINDMNALFETYKSDVSDDYKQFRLQSFIDSVKIVFSKDDYLK